MIRIIVYTIKLIAAAAAALLVASCGPEIKGDGNRIVAERSISEGFDRIEVGQGIELLVTQADQRKVTVEADANIIPHIITDVEGQTLYIRTDASYNTDQSPIVRVNLPKLHAVTASSGSRAVSQNTIIADDLTLETNSGAGLEFDVEADNISIGTSSGSNAAVKGKALRLTTSSSSGSTLDAAQLKTNEVTSTASSGSNTSVHPIQLLTGTASSGGSVGYVTEPKGNVSKSESSGGSVYKK